MWTGKKKLKRCIHSLYFIYPSCLHCRLLTAAVASDIWDAYPLDGADCYLSPAVSASAITANISIAQYPISQSGYRYHSHTDQRYWAITHAENQLLISTRCKNLQKSEGDELTAEMSVLVGTIITVGLLITPPCNVDALTIWTFEFVRAACIGCTHTHTHTCTYLDCAVQNDGSIVTDASTPMTTPSQWIYYSVKCLCVRSRSLFLQRSMSTGSRIVTCRLTRAGTASWVNFNTNQFHSYSDLQLLWM